MDSRSARLRPRRVARATSLWIINRNRSDAANSGLTRPSVQALLNHAEHLPEPKRWTLLRLILRACTSLTFLIRSGAVPVSKCPLRSDLYRGFGVPPPAVRSER